MPVTGPATMAPNGTKAPIQLASVVETSGMSQVLLQRLSSICGKAGDVQAKAVPRPKDPRVAEI